MKEATQKVILRLKEVKDQKRLSQQDIFELCATAGEFVSKSSIRRVFANGSEHDPSFRQTTIDPIFHALIGTEEFSLSEAEEAALSDTEKEVITENSALKAMIEMKDATITVLNEKIERLGQDIMALETQLNHMTTKYHTATELIQVAMESFGRGSAVR